MIDLSLIKNIDEDNNLEENSDVKFYKNGSIHVIYEGRTTKNDLKESLEKRLNLVLDNDIKNELLEINAKTPFLDFSIFCSAKQINLT